MKKLFKQLFNHERYQSISIIAACVVVLIMSSCVSKTASILDPTKKVTYEELAGEAELIMQRVNAGIVDIQTQNAIKEDIRTILLNAANTGGFSLGSIATAALGLIGSGAVIDNFRKRKDVKKLELKLMAETGVAGSV